MQSNLIKASAWITAKWLEGIMRNAHGADAETDLAEFGAFQANLAEVIALDRGADFLVSRWGAEIGMLCGGNQRNRRLSTLPQPSRGQLRRICVRAMTSRTLAAESAVWAVRGGIWECLMLALPAADTEDGISSLLIALLFAPHPLFDHPFQRDDAALAVAAPTTAGSA
ncbi:hypothetical protein QA641_32130 [Bradyrhizobium sp. CB1650]|uniref:hypothetical protein n=1 Tax=Bradyrhizobium sp. CB1650 TaxID=3039153 RepID=UPI002435216F|nr:hypothetical protein [Bradyrhizobium sp. CB1650]WGD50227.1 hypothetical protein QA641_32130 [Bradyrhizobium sp. CB1650]